MSAASAVATASLPETATAMATSLTHSVSAAGPCEADADSDGICDDIDPCVGELDACGVCNGPGEIYECGCSDIPKETATATATSLTSAVCGGDGIPAGDCDCDGNQLDAIGGVVVSAKRT